MKATRVCLEHLIDFSCCVFVFFFCEISSTLHHPSIVQFLGIASNENSHCIVSGKNFFYLLSLLSSLLSPPLLSFSLSLAFSLFLFPLLSPLPHFSIRFSFLCYLHCCLCSLLPTPCPLFPLPFFPPLFLHLLYLFLRRANVSVTQRLPSISLAPHS